LAALGQAPMPMDARYDQGDRSQEMGCMSNIMEVRPFSIDVPGEDLVELRRRIAATRWPEKETVADQSQGVQLATIQELVRYWGSDYDLRRFEGRLNALPQFMTEIDGLGIHFIHVKSPHQHALPLLITHGWPGSVIEMLNVVGPLSDPTAATRRMPSMWWFPPCPATGCQPNRRRPAGTLSTSPVRGSG
jgi:Epoxide hydrolase N terminus